MLHEGPIHKKLKSAIGRRIAISILLYNAIEPFAQTSLKHPLRKQSERVGAVPRSLGTPENGDGPHSALQSTLHCLPEKIALVHQIIADYKVILSLERWLTEAKQ